MTKLKPCPCGKTPGSIGTYPSVSGCKWAFVDPDCCGTWMIEFRTQYETGDKLLKLAIEAWNDAPRGQGNK